MNPTEPANNVNIEDEIKKSYLDYAMSVIVGRALPDVRDGLKPVHRRILFAMRELGNDYNKPYKKSARVVGDTIGKYHPHGESAVYDAVVRMAQDFSMRYPLVDGQGNFGSIDGDPPAAMRYTEVRMAKMAHEFVGDLDKETVDFTPNYDGSLEEPLVLPTRIPNLLVNGSSGIAVGMATNIPPHNLREITAAAIALIQNPNISVAQLMEKVPGPDFPTAGFIYGTAGIKEAYETGRGIIRMRARALIEKKGRLNRESIIVTELPYQVNKARMLEKVAELVRDKKITGIQEIRDESDREGMRVVFDLKRDENAGVILNQLYKYTQMQSTFGIIMLAIANRRPELMNLKEMLLHFVNFRKEVVIRRTQYELRKAEERAHILEGLKIALDNLDAIIQLIRSSKSVAEARQRLMENFELSEIQANAILDMRLQRLTALEREKIEEEYKKLIKDINRMREILANERLVMNIVEQELQEVTKSYGDDRRTEIIAETQEISVEDLITEEEMVVTISHKGYIKRNPISLYRSQRRGGKGVTGMETREDDFVERLFVASTHSMFLFFTNFGRLYWKKVHEIPQAGRVAKGKALVNLLDLRPGEWVATVLPVRNFEEDNNYVVMCTRRGYVKKTELKAFSNPRSIGIIALTIPEGDELIAVGLTEGTSDTFLASHKGKCARFDENEIRPMGRMARGVIGMRLESSDHVVGMELISNGTTLLTITENGYGKRTPIDQYRKTGRGAKGVITIQTTERNGMVVGFLQVTNDDEIMIITDVGKIIRMKVNGISIIGRNTQGVRLIGLDPGDKVVAVAKLAEKGEE
jgi:DNA gyrase subunit A